MNRLLTSVVCAGLALLVACESEVESIPASKPVVELTAEQSKPEVMPETSDNESPSHRPPYPAPTRPGHFDLAWNDLNDGRRVAIVRETDHVDELPLDVESVNLSGISWGCFGRDFRVGDDEISRMKVFPKLRTLTVGVPITKAGFEAIAELPALEEHTLSIYDVDAECLRELRNAACLKTLTLQGDETRLDTTALRGFEGARPDVTVIR